MLATNPVRLRFCSSLLHPPRSSNDSVCSSEYLTDGFSIHGVIICHGYLLRLSPLKIEGVLVVSISNAKFELLSGIHVSLLRALLREVESTWTWMQSIDCKGSVNLNYHLLYCHNRPCLLTTYLGCVKPTESVAHSVAFSFLMLSAETASPGGVVAATDSILTATLFPEGPIPLNTN